MFPFLLRDSRSVCEKNPRLTTMFEPPMSEWDSGLLSASDSSLMGREKRRVTDESSRRLVFLLSRSGAVLVGEGMSGVKMCALKIEEDGFCEVGGGTITLVGSRLRERHQIYGRDEGRGWLEII